MSSNFAWYPTYFKTVVTSQFRQKEKGMKHKVNTPNPLPVPEVGRREEVKTCFDLATVAWGNNDPKEFTLKVAEAFCWDTHDFCFEVSCDTNIGRCIAAIYDLEESGDSSNEFHTLKMVMGVMDTRGVLYANGLFAIQKN
jgi:hypothetical protein